MWAGVLGSKKPTACSAVGWFAHIGRVCSLGWQGSSGRFGGRVIVSWREEEGREWGCVM